MPREKAKERKKERAKQKDREREKGKHRELRKKYSWIFLHIRIAM